MEHTTPDIQQSTNTLGFLRVTLVKYLLKYPWNIPTNQVIAHSTQNKAMPVKPLFILKTG